MSERRIVIIGAGLAGATAAATLRADGFDGHLTLIGEERHLPYERPKLSKEYLRGEVTAADLAVHAPPFYAANDIELVTGARATGIRLDERLVLLGAGRPLRYEGLLLATGAGAIRPAIDGIDLPGVHLLRTIEDAERLRAAAGQSGAALVVGGGWIAAEAAASLRQLGLEVTLVVPGTVPLERSLGTSVGGIYADLHRRHGTRVITGSRLVGVVGRRHVTAVRLDTGRVLHAGLVVLGLGAAARVDLAARAGLDLGDGVLVDQRLATSAPGVFAAGDVAAAWHPTLGARVRSEHWDNAIAQARTAARNLLGRGLVHDQLPYVFSDQFELGMEYVGLGGRKDRAVVRRQEGDDGFVAFWVRGSRIVAGMQANRWAEMPAVRRLVESGRPVDRRRLADPSVPLEEILPSVAQGVGV